MDINIECGTGRTGERIVNSELGTSYKLAPAGAKESEIKFYMYPDNFLENSKLYNLTEEDITEKLTHTDTHL